MLRSPTMQLGLGNASSTDILADGGAHLRVVDVPLPHGTALPDLSAEQTPQRSKMQLVPFLAGGTRQQHPEVAFPPAGPADGDKTEKGLRQ